MIVGFIVVVIVMIVFMFGIKFESVFVFIC